MEYNGITKEKAVLSESELNIRDCLCEDEMAKFGKTLFALAAIGAAAAGTYYYMQKKNGEIPANMEDDDDFDSFDVDAEDGNATAKAKRSYVNIDLDAVEEKAKDFAGKAANVAVKAADSFSSFVSQAEGKVEEFFDDRKAQREADEASAEFDAEMEELKADMAEMEADLSEMKTDLEDAAREVAEDVSDVTE